MEPILKEDPHWVIDQEPIENQGVIQSQIEPTDDEPIAIPLPAVDRTVIEPEALPSEVTALLEPLPDADQAVDVTTLPQAEELPPKEMIDQYRDYDFRAMIDPEGDNWYGRDDESMGDLLLKWGGNTPLLGLKGLYRIAADEYGLPDIFPTDAKQLAEARMRYLTNASEAVKQSPEGVEYFEYLTQRLNKTVNPVDVGFGEFLGLFGDAIVDHPGEALKGFARVIVDDPLAMYGFVKAYQGGKALGLKGASTQRFVRLLKKLETQGKAGQRAAAIARNITKITPAIMADGLTAVGYESMNNLMRGKPIEHNVTNMGILAGVLAGTGRTIGVKIENFKEATHLGTAARPGDTKVSERMADVQKIIGGEVREGAVELPPASSSQMDLPGIKTIEQFEKQMNYLNSLKERIAKQKEKKAAYKSEKDEINRLSGTTEDFKRVLSNPMGEVYKLKRLTQGWKLKSAFTDPRLGGSGLVNFDKATKTISMDIAQLAKDPVAAFSRYIEPKLTTAFGRSYSAAAKEIGFDLNKLRNIASTPEEMLRFAVLKEKHYINTHQPIPKKINASKAYRDARNMYRHEVSLYKTLREMGEDVSQLRDPGKWVKPTKVKVAERVSKIVNNTLKPAVKTLSEDFVQPVSRKVRDTYRNEMTQRTQVPYVKGDVVHVDTKGIPVSNQRIGRLSDKAYAAAKGIEAGSKEISSQFIGLFDDTIGQRDIPLDIGFKQKAYKGIHIGHIRKMMSMLKYNKKGSLATLLGKNPAAGVVISERGRDHIDRWLGDNAIMDRHAMGLQHRIMSKLPDKDSRTAASHYLEGNLNEYNVYRNDQGLGAVTLTSAQKAYLDNTIRPILADMFTWANKNNLIGKDPRTGGVRYRHHYLPHVPKQDFKTSFEDYVNELMSKGKSAVSMKASSAYERTYKTIMEAQESGVPMHTDLAKIMSTYVRGMWRVEANRMLVNALKTTKVGDEGLVMLRDAAPDDYIEIRHPTMMDQAGEYMKAHPALIDDLKMIFDISDSSAARRLLVNINTTAKRLQIGLSLFHAAALLQSTLFAGLNPLKAKKLYHSSLERLRTGPMGDEIDGYLRAGLKIGGIDDVNSEALIHLMEATEHGLDSMVPNKAMGAAFKLLPWGIRTITKKIDAFTWDHVMTTGKIISMDKAYSDLIRADILRAKKTGTPLTPESRLMNQAAIYTNDAFGGLDWKRIARTASNKGGHHIGSYLGSKHGRESMQLVAFAPDWTTANFRILFKGLPGASSNKAMGNLYRAYFARALSIYLMAAEGLQQANTNTSVFDNYGKRGWLRPHIGDGIHIELAKQFTEVPRYMSYFSEGDLRTLTHKSSSVFHLILDIINGKAPADALQDSVTPFAIQNMKEDGFIGVGGALGFPLYDYSYPYK